MYQNYIIILRTYRGRMVEQVTPGKDVKRSQLSGAAQVAMARPDCKDATYAEIIATKPRRTVLDVVHRAA